MLPSLSYSALREAISKIAYAAEIAITENRIVTARDFA
jgi:hypothetical protein